jgi:hypothetical protein
MYQSLAKLSWTGNVNPSRTSAESSVKSIKGVVGFAVTVKRNSTSGT